MTPSANGHQNARLAREVDCLYDIGHADAPRDDRRALVVCPVPDSARRLVLRIADGEYGSSDTVPQRRKHIGRTGGRRTVSHRQSERRH
jgi:hypothetical protein